MMNFRREQSSQRFRTIYLLLLTILLGLGDLYAWDDEELFYVSVKPNIVIMMDTSGSMANVIFHPEFVPGTGTGSVSRIGVNFSYSRWVARWYSNGNSYIWDPESSTTNTTGVTAVAGNVYTTTNSSSRYNNFNVGDVVIAASYNQNYQEGVFRITAKSTRYFTLEWIAGSTTITPSSTIRNISLQKAPNASYSYRVVNIFGCQDPINNATSTYRYSGEGTYDYVYWLFNNATDTQRAAVSWFADHGSFDTGDSTVYSGRFTRIQVARSVLSDIIEQFKNKVRMGVIRLNGSEGGVLASYSGTYATVRSLKDDADRAELTNIVTHQAPNANTPLGEAMNEVWRYYMGTNSKYVTGTDYDPTDTWDLFCRQSFCILLTDGMPNSEGNFDTVTENVTEPFETHAMNQPWTGAPYIPTGNDNGSVVNVVYYMANNDARTDLEGVQNVRTYTIGFTTAGDANDVLTHAATNGKGVFYSASNYDNLLTAFDEIVGNITEESSAFAAFTAPKLTSTDDDYKGYVATFIPRKTYAMWEGHLSCYQLDDDGNFVTNVAGELISPLWDAGLQLSLRAASSRSIWTFLNTTREYSAANFSNLELNAADDAQREQIVTIVRGDTTSSTYTYPYSLKDPLTGPNKLGDFFHFQPVVVGEPLKWRTYYDSSFKAYYTAYKNRKKVVYAGANDGMLHCFNAADGEELWAFIPPIHLKKLKSLGLNSQHEYYVDGQGACQEIKINGNSNASAWRTVLIFGLGQGGQGYYALDVSDPEAAMTDRFLWELSVPVHGANAGKTVLTQKNGTQTVLHNEAILGETPGTPAFGNIANGSSTIPIVALGGGYDSDNASGATNKRGKSLFILNAYTGEVIKQFEYNASNSNSATKQQSSAFQYSIAAAPKLVTTRTTALDKPTISEYVYLADTGGCIWKIDITSTNHANWTLDQIFDTNSTMTNSGLSRQPFFIAPTIGFDDQYRLWVLAGTGNRNSPNDQATEGVFYSFIDDGNHPEGGYLPNDLQDLGNLFDNTTLYDSDGDGWTNDEETDAGTDPYDEASTPAGDPPTETGSEVTSPHGFYFDFSLGGTAGEKMFEPSPIYFNHYVIFNTYTPNVNTVNDETCDPKGNMRVYQFRLLSSSSGTASKIDAMSGAENRILGSGTFLSSGDSGESAFKVFMGTSSPYSPVVDGVKDLKLSDIYGPMFWLENRR